MRTLGAQEAIRAACEGLGLTALRSVDVVHCSHAWAAILEHTQGWKVVYSGDTRPCQRLTQAAHGASLLIHEATFEDTLLHEAVAKNHSLTREAVETGTPPPSAQARPSPHTTSQTPRVRARCA